MTIFSEKMKLVEIIITILTTIIIWEATSEIIKVDANDLIILNEKGILNWCTDKISCLANRYWLYGANIIQNFLISGQLPEEISLQESCEASANILARFVRNKPAFSLVKSSTKIVSEIDYKHGTSVQNIIQDLAKNAKTKTAAENACVCCMLENMETLSLLAGLLGYVILRIITGCNKFDTLILGGSILILSYMHLSLKNQLITTVIIFTSWLTKKGMQPYFRRKTRRILRDDGLNHEESFYELIRS